MFKLGIDLIDEHLDIFEGKRVGLITNHTGIASDGVSSIDILNEKCNLKALFAPEHGIRGAMDAGEVVESFIDLKTGVTVYSLYNDTRRPTEEMLDNVDIIAVDIQDIGSRFYTYIYTMSNAMEEAKKYNKKVVVFDRPNPIGRMVSGNMLDMEYRSFIGRYPILQRHGMTIGELALLFNDLYIGCSLEVIKMKDYDPSKYLDEYTKNWVNPSPAIHNLNTALIYNSTCIFEGTNISEGRGTDIPFIQFGAPFIDSDVLLNAINEYALEGVEFKKATFTPTKSKHSGIECYGLSIKVIDRYKFDTIKTAYTLIDVIRKNFKEFSVNPPYKVGGKKMLELNTGVSYVASGEMPLEEELKINRKDEEYFKTLRKKYLLY